MARTSKYYKVTHNDHYNNFIIGQKLIYEIALEFYEIALEFVYKDAKLKEIHKIIPLKAIGPYLKQKRMFSRSEDGKDRVFKGTAYEIPAHVVYNY